MQVMVAEATEKKSPTDMGTLMVKSLMAKGKAWLANQNNQSCMQLTLRASDRDHSSDSDSYLSVQASLYPRNGMLSKDNDNQLPYEW